ncbi:hypothetical protein TVAG_220760 [Trichomonas vaginalis G3]|uniref:Uncharacterized protein n=1 Tax=Trichomonas vaginalis (strain ATCC PRA-98 / G3) TaxID=412133 RepID=A2FQU4_TRIV3|nr:hypothetical protein TVAGG3_0513830 [Trichomonas vaginalis G3]EAX92713.1 hypothetical protein TVAG_220760 [Trichomonas vaginalis G3]KAI5517970.1 hypothetical protein TVAGG3_0513830 [Trichomonas vaginalis G3]|eukprot:XP_001305643.1 hypothetical protein [Trichomonas vaginalis G3]
MSSNANAENASISSTYSSDNDDLLLKAVNEMPSNNITPDPSSLSLSQAFPKDAQNNTKSNMNIKTAIEKITKITENQKSKENSEPLSTKKSSSQSNDETVPIVLDRNPRISENVLVPQSSIDSQTKEGNGNDSLDNLGSEYDDPVIIGVINSNENKETENKKGNKNKTTPKSKDNSKSASSKTEKTKSHMSTRSSQNKYETNSKTTKKQTAKQNTSKTNEENKNQKSKSKTTEKSNDLQSKPDTKIITKAKTAESTSNRKNSKSNKDNKLQNDDSLDESSDTTPEKLSEASSSEKISESSSDSSESEVLDSYSSVSRSSSINSSNNSDSDSISSENSEIKKSKRKDTKRKSFSQKTNKPEPKNKQRKAQTQKQTKTKTNKKKYPNSFEETSSNQEISNDSVEEPPIPKVEVDDTLPPFIPSPYYETVYKIYRFFDEKIPFVSILIAIHQSFGDVYEAIVKLSHGQIEQDTRLFLKNPDPEELEKGLRYYT